MRAGLKHVVFGINISFMVLAVCQRTSFDSNFVLDFLVCRVMLQVMMSW